MLRPIRPSLVLTLIGLTSLISLSASRASAAAAQFVQDDAHLFKDATIEQVNGIIKEIHDKFDKDLTIKTFAAIPERLQPSFAAETKDDFYERWLRSEARLAETNGIFILIVKNPGRLQIGVGNETHLKAFTFEDRDELRDLMLKSFGQKNFDEGMIAGAKFVEDRLDKNHGGNAKNPSTAPTQAPPATQPAAEKAKSDAPATNPAVEQKSQSVELNK